MKRTSHARARSPSASSPSTDDVIGVDGARGGWVAATRAGVEGFARFADLRAAHPRAHLFVDIPIGLLDARQGSGDRPCDKLARATLAPRRGLVFPPPRRAQLRHAARPFRTGLGMSAQTHAILPKILEVDPYRDDARVHEAHPELAFLLANRGTPLASKHTAEGRAQRRWILERLTLYHEPTGLGVGAKRDDVDDASILLWLGHEALAGRARALGERGRAIWGVRKG